MPNGARSALASRPANKAHRHSSEQMGYWIYQEGYYMLARSTSTIYLLICCMLLTSCAGQPAIATPTPTSTTPIASSTPSPTATPTVSPAPQHYTAHTNLSGGGS